MSNEIIIQSMPCDAGLRLDSFLAAKLTDFTRAQLNKIIKEDLVSINNKSAKPSFKLVGREKIIIIMPAIKSTKLLAEDLPLDIIYSDDHIAVINKKSGMVVHPGAGISENTLVNALLYYFPKLEIGGSERPGIVHRLDKNTSGLIVVALSHKAHVALTEAFKNREVEKIYRAFCYGDVEQEYFELKTGHARHAFNRLRFFTGLPVPQSSSSKIRLAHTSFKRRASVFGICDIEAKLHSGRTHQIRAHLADINHPLLGDRLYGGMRMLCSQAPQDLVVKINGLKGQALHAERLSFKHPVSQILMSFKAPLPEYLTAISEYFT